MYDFIGDIHGFADELKALLEKMGYSQTNGIYCHPMRKAFFAGDFIDVGPQIRETLQIVKGMVDNGHALAIMGNHEYNAVCYNIPVGNGKYLREHNNKNKDQHAETVDQFKNHRTEYEHYLQWFKTLPLFYEADNFRVVHACWDSGHINTINEMLKSSSYCQNKVLTTEFFKATSDKSDNFHTIIEETLKGKEILLPEGRTIADNKGHSRPEVRIKWWQDPAGKKWSDVSFHAYPELPEGIVDTSQIRTAGRYYPEQEKPVFFGHYWCKGAPKLFRSNICCLDYSVAKNDKLVAYRFNGESQLNENNFVFVNARDDNS